MAMRGDTETGREGTPAVGSSTRRREDPALITGYAEYTDDWREAKEASLAILRSSYGHARLRGVDTTDAESRPGVLGVYTWEDIEDSSAHGIIPGVAPTEIELPGYPILAREKVRFHGQPIAIVVTEDKYIASDALDAIDVDYDPLDAVTDPSDASPGDGEPIHEEAPENIALEYGLGDRDAVNEQFEEADHVVSLDIRNNRLVPNAIEPRAALATYNPGKGQLTVVMSSQAPHRHREKLSATLRVPEQKIKVVSPDVGGGFGHKGHHHPGEALTAWSAMRLNRPVKWVSTRSDEYQAGAHGRDHVTRGKLALDSNGKIEALWVESDIALGGYALGGAPVINAKSGRWLPNQYDIPAVYSHVSQAFTNAAPVHAYRGSSKPPAIYITERLLDAAARTLDIDPAELRRRNLIPSDAFPYETATGQVYDTGDYEGTLDLALDAVEYDELRERQERLREKGRYLGIGISNYIDSNSSGFGGGSVAGYESSLVRVQPTGGVSVYVGNHSHGQGHKTTYAQIVSDTLDIPMDDIEVVQGDTERIPTGVGTFGSRSAVMGGNSVASGAEKVLEKAKRIAAKQLEIDVADLEYEDGTFRAAGAPQRELSFAEVAKTSYSFAPPEGDEAGLDETTFFSPNGTAHTFGTHVAVVEVDTETGDIDVERYIAVDDCGRRINPLLVEGQIHGGIAQGVGQALYEHAVYDDNGTLITGSHMDYTVPRAHHLPDFETVESVTPTDHNPLGAKGIGEAGTTASPPAIVNAVVDALEPFGIDHVDMPLTPENVWQAVHEAEQD